MPKPAKFVPSADATTYEQVQKEAMEFYTARHNAELDADPKKYVNFGACSRAAAAAAKRWQREET